DDVEQVAAGVDPVFRQVRAVVPEDIIQYLQRSGQNLGTEVLSRAVEQHLWNSDVDGLQVVGRDVARFASTIAVADELGVRDDPEAPAHPILLVQHAALDLQQWLVIEEQHGSTLPVPPVH
ncbi:hypothetical protein EMCRGX_G020461, partial [Ephydatia muelleri]